MSSVDMGVVGLHYFFMFVFHGSSKLRDCKFLLIFFMRSFENVLCVGVP